MGASRRIKQVYHPFTKWECFKNGMWDDVLGIEAEKLLPFAIEFTGDHILYGNSMKKVIYKWKYSCENFLTDLNINRKAWLGHAACSFEHKLPENIVRMAWKKLSNEQRYLANLQAEKFINEWEFNFRNKLKTNQLYLFNENRNREIYKFLGK